MGRRVGCALPANGGEVDHLDTRILDALAAVVIGVLRITPAEHDNILVSNQRLQPFQVGDEIGPAPGRERQVHRRGLAVRLGIGLIKVGMTVQEQARAPIATCREHAAKQD